MLLSPHTFSPIFISFIIFTYLLAISTFVSGSKQVAFTSNIPPSMLKIDTSNVPPPKSNIKTFCSFSVFFLSKPYAIAAAVGSLMILTISRPAIMPASFVAYLYESLKYAGTVTTAYLIIVLLPTYDCAMSFIFVKIILLISSGLNDFF